ncbi:MAG: hypothetical protein A2017_13485 [Lentisphaerae bacterium GWF2_44_16]|nr:MAG: hypothetical protein A2017_13485 [Lentisphaerae bacterium GWF2_44_16]
MEIIISFATEDFITPEHDEVLLWLAEMLSKRGIKGCFHLTGDLARELRDRRRKDIIRALQKHEIGYHCNTHGAYPFIFSVCENMDWDSAVSRLMETEAKGIHDISEITGTFPKYFVIEFARAPQLIYAMRMLGISTLGLSELPSMEKPFVSYAGSLCYSGPIMGLEPPQMEQKRLQNMKNEFDALYSKASEGEYDGILKVFLHPYKLIYPHAEASWVSRNDIYRKYDVKNKWLVPPLFPAKTIKRLHREFEEIVDYILEHKGVKFLSTSELSDKYRTRYPSFVTLKSLLEIAEKSIAETTFIKSGGIYYSPAEILAMAVYALKEFEKNKKLPEEIIYRNILGPVESAPPFRKTGKIKTENILKTMDNINRKIDFHQRMPSHIEIGKDTLPPGGAFKLLMKVLVSLSKGNKLPYHEAGSFQDFPSVSEEKYFQTKTFTRPIYPENFTGKNICVSNKLQSWSYKPSIKI